MMDNSSSTQSAKRHCVDVNHFTQQLRYPPPLVTMVAPQPCFTRAPPPNHPRGPIHTPAPPYLREDPPLRDTAPISDQGPPSSSHWQVLRTSIGVFVVCPVCKSRARSGLLLEHMKEHRYQTTEWGKFRACQLCMDQGDSSTNVAPEDLWSHVFRRHILKGHFPSSPAPQPSTRTTANLLPLQPIPDGHPMPSPIPTPGPGSWQIFETKKGDHWVICPSLSKCHVKLQYLATHMWEAHRANHVLFKLKCQGCKQRVPLGKLSAHINCQKPPSTPPRTLPGQAQDPEWARWIKRVQMKRNASTPA